MTRIAPIALIAAAAWADTSGGPGRTDARRFAEVVKYAPDRRAWQVAPGGRHVILQNGTQVDVLDAATGRTVGELKGHGTGLHDAGWSRDGRYLATAGYDAQVKLWDLAEMKELAGFSLHAGFS
jgi:WD40 repeat protein